jgi:hypothetical protein
MSRRFKPMVVGAAVAATLATIVLITAFAPSMPGERDSRTRR